MNTTTNEIHRMAVGYHSRNLSVIPVMKMEQDHKGKYSKAPAVQSLKTYLGRRATLEELKEWFTREGHTSIAICTGKISNIVVVDCDSEEAALLVLKMDFPKTPLCKTKRGYHFYFQYNAAHGFRNGPSALPAVDIKTDGGYVICPPSRYADGTFTYEWVYDIMDYPPIEMPALLVKELKPEQEKPPGSKPPTLDSLLDGIRTAPEHTRNETLNRNAFMAARSIPPGMDKDAVRAKLVAAGVEAGLPLGEAGQTVDSGLNSGMDRLPAARGDKLPPHMRLAKDVIAANPDIRHSKRGWMRYEGGIWAEEDDALVSSRILTMLERVYGPDNECKMGDVNSIRDMMKCDVSIQVPSDRFDAQHDWLVFNNGCLNVADGRLAPHEPELYATIRFNHDYTPGAQAPTWMRFIAGRFPADTAHFLQEFAGYALTTGTSLETAVWLNGQRGGGKSTFIEGIKAALGSRCGRFGLSELQDRFGLSQIVGKTLLYCSEQPSVYMARSDVLNTIISGETVSVERKHREAFEYNPVGKILWAMNELPRIPSANNGIFRRVRVVEMQALPAGQLDPQVKEAIKKEGPGILLWMIEGLLRLKRNGYKFTQSETVKAATDEFKEDTDVVAMFVQQCCRRGDGPEYCVPSGQLCLEYNDWAEKSSSPRMSSIRLATEWKRLGLKSCRVNGGERGWKGIRLIRTGTTSMPCSQAA